MAFDAKYFNWNQKKLKGILEFYDPAFLKSRKILDLGCGYADISGSLYRYGADVTAADCNQDYLKIVSKRYPGIKIVRTNLNEQWLFDNKKFDLILSLDVIHYLNDYKNHLKKICTNTSNLVLELPVYNCDGEHVFITIDPVSGQKIYIPTSTAIENTLSELGMSYSRLDNGEYNSGNYKYDWKSSNSEVFSINHRRIWICKKNAVGSSHKLPTALKDSAISLKQNETKVVNTDVVAPVHITEPETRTNKQSVTETVAPHLILPQQENLATSAIIHKINENIKPMVPLLASIIIPAFKASKFLDECLQSVIKSIGTYNVEIIIGIDACSETLNWFKSKTFKNLKVYWFKDNVGPYIVKNTLAGLASSENLLFFDADDIMAPNMVENFLKNIRSSSIIKFKYCDFNHSAGVNHPLPNTWYGEGVFGITKHIFNKLNGFEGWRCAADTEFQLRAKNNKIPSKNVSNLSFYRRLHSNNLTVNTNTKYGSSIRQGYIKLINDKVKNKKWNVIKKHTSHAELIDMKTWLNTSQIVTNANANANANTNHVLSTFNSKYFTNKQCLIIGRDTYETVDYINKANGKISILSDLNKSNIKNIKYNNISFTALLKNKNKFDVIILNCKDIDFNWLKDQIYNLYIRCMDLIIHPGSEQIETILLHHKIAHVKNNLDDSSCILFSSKRPHILQQFQKKFNSVPLITNNTNNVINMADNDTSSEPDLTPDINFTVYHSIPWNSHKNIGHSYNQFMSLLQDNDWACFLDGDAVHTTTFFGKNIELIIQANPEYGLFTCYTNRIGCSYQMPGNYWNNDSQAYHRNIGEKLWKQHGTNVLDITNKSPLSGVLILINKSKWNEVGGFKEEKMLSVDNDIHLRFKNAGFKVGLMQGIYVQHWYRNGKQKEKSHLL